VLDRLDTFVAFVRRRTGDPELAAEVVQEALRKALASQGGLSGPEHLLPWFWRIVRTTMADALTARGRMVPFAAESATPAPVVSDRELCACLEQVVASLPERQRVAIQRVDLAEDDPSAVAAGLGLSQGNLKVIRHRARESLRQRLLVLCGACARHGCLDCHCREPGRN